MARKPESKLQLAIGKAIQNEWPSSWGFKVHGGPFQASGVPDRIHCIYGIFFGVEVKHPDERRAATPLQLKTIELINASGGCAFVTYSAAAAIRKIRQHLIQKAPNWNYYAIAQNQALLLSGERRTLRVQEKKHRPDNGRRDRKNTNSIPRRRKKVEAPKNKTRRSVLPQNRDRRLGKTG